jgi:hypothetical protein
MPTPFRIESDTLFSEISLCRETGLSPSCIIAARKAGKLRSARIGQRYYFLGNDILVWLRSEMKAKPEPRRRRRADLVS